MRVLLALISAVVLFSAFSCMNPAPNDKYPYGREEIKKEHLEQYEGLDR
jgi:hypothetical protein